MSTVLTTWVRALALLATGAVAGLAFNAVRPHGVGLRAGTSSQVPGMCAQPAMPTIPAEHSIEILAPDQAAGLCGDPRTLVADARTAHAFAEGHVTGAIHLPCASTRGAASAALDLLAGKQALIVYGSGTEDAIPVAEEMRRRGDRPDLRVAVLAGGFEAWNQAGLACSSGPCRDCQAPVHQ